MPEHDRLSNLILDHWSRYHPSMLARLKQENRLEGALEETASEFATLMYQLVSVQKMEHHQAWELAVTQFLLPEESSSTTPPNDPPATSESPVPSGSDWAARMRRRKPT